MTIEELLKALGVEVNEDNTSQVELLIASETAGLKTNRDKFRSERDKARAQLKAVDGLDVEEVREALGIDDLSLDELPDLIRKAKAGEKNPALDDRVAELEGKLERADKRNKEAGERSDALVGALKTKLAKSAVESMVTDAVAKESGNITLLKPHLVGRVKTEVDDEGAVTMTILAANGEPMEDKHGNPALVKQLIDEFANNETFAAAFEATGVGGSGNKESKNSRRAANNPWAKDTLNLTRQAEIRAEDPALADRLKAEAGA